MDDNILYDAEELLKQEISEIVADKKAGKQLSYDDVCCVEKMLKGIESARRSVMLQQAGNDYNNQMTYEDRVTNNGYGYGMSNNSYNLRGSYANNNSRGNSYARGRSGHDADIRMMLEDRIGMARNEQERAVYQNWLNELDGRR